MARINLIGGTNDINNFCFNNNWNGETYTMDDKLKDKAGELIKVKFAMNTIPTDIQITKHVTNMLVTYPNQRRALLKYFKEYLQGQALNVNGPGVRIRQMVDYYGKHAMKKWFRDVYGWKFKRVKKVS